VQDYIQASRSLLISSLVQNDKKEQLESIRSKTEDKEKELSNKKSAF